VLGAFAEFWEAQLFAKLMVKLRAAAWLNDPASQRRQLEHILDLLHGPDRDRPTNH
jgi:hypothetical protein